MVINQWNITLFIQQKNWMQRARHDFISGKPDVSDSTWRWQRSALAQRSGVHRFVNFVVYYFGLFGMLKQTALSLYICLTGLFVHAIRLHVSEVPCSGAVSAHTSLLVCRARVQMNRTQAHLLQPSQGLLNKPRPSAAQSDHISQTNRALGLRRTRARFKTPSVGTPLENNRIT